MFIEHQGPLLIPETGKLSYFTFGSRCGAGKTKSHIEDGHLI